MSYQVIARRWRPQRFSEVVGQEPVVTSLMHAIRQGRVSPVTLFTGIRGTGKTTLARLLVKAVNCLTPEPDGEPCNKCENCIEIVNGRSPDVFEIDGASNNSVDDVRTIRENIIYAPVKSKRKVYIIDEVHMLSKSAFNALLKTLEEPPAHALFILATTDPQKIPTTVLSRCQRYDLRRLSLSAIVEQLKKILDAEQIPYDDDALYTIAREGEGSMRDAQTIVEQMLAFGDRKVTKEVVSLILGTTDRTLVRRFVEALATRDSRGAVAAVHEIYRSGKALERASQDILTLIHHLSLAASLGSTTDLDASDEEKRWIEETAQRQGSVEWLRLFDFWNRQHDLIVRSDYALMLFEVSALMAASFPTMEDIRTFLDMVRKGTPSPTFPAPGAHTSSVPPKAPRPVETATNPPGDKSDKTAGWREFLDHFQKEDSFLGLALKSARYREFPDRVEVTVNKTLDQMLNDGKRSTVANQFAAFSGGKKLSFIATPPAENSRSVVEEEKREEEEQNAKAREEVRNDPTVKVVEQLGFELKKIGKL